MKIVINNHNITEDFSKEEKSLLNEKIKMHGTVEVYLQSLLKSDLTSLVNLGYDIVYNSQKEEFIKSNKTSVKLTRLEALLFNYLLLKKNTIVSIEEIDEIVWKGKNMTRYTLRNKIKSLRDKTYYELFKNHSNIGYELVL